MYSYCSVVWVFECKNKKETDWQMLLHLPCSTVCYTCDMSWVWRFIMDGIRVMAMIIQRHAFGSACAVVDAGIKEEFKEKVNFTFWGDMEERWRWWRWRQQSRLYEIFGVMFLSLPCYSRWEKLRWGKLTFNWLAGCNNIIIQLYMYVILIESQKILPIAFFALSCHSF